VGVHLLHRMNGYLFTLTLAMTCVAARWVAGLGRILGVALTLALCQVAVGIANVRLGLPVEVTGLHSALAAGLVLALAAATRRAWAIPRTSSGVDAVLHTGAVKEPHG